MKLEGKMSQEQNKKLAHLAGAVKYTNCFSEEG